jgi:hypothetical protein
MSRSDAGATSGSRRRAARCAGFAYIWVLLLVAFLAVGLTIGLEIHSVAEQRDKERELLSIGHQFRSALGSYYESQVGEGAQQAGRRQYPASLDELLRDSRFPGLKRHLRRIFIDPMSGRAEWGELRVAGRIVGIYSLSGKTPIKQDHFEAEDMALRQKQKYSEWVFTYPADLLLRPEATPQGDVTGAKPAEDEPTKVHTP